MSKRPHVSKPQSAPSSSKKERTHTKGANTGPIAFFIALFVIAVGSIQIISAFHTYAINLSELNSLKKQEAVLAAQKKDLENDIARWDAPAYVTAQARERLGYVFPGEQAIKVEHPEAVSGEQPKSDANANTETGQSNLPWYSELAYSFKESDARKPDATNNGNTAESRQQNDPDATAGTDAPQDGGSAGQ